MLAARPLRHRGARRRRSTRRAARGRVRLRDADGAEERRRGQRADQRGRDAEPARRSPTSTASTRSRDRAFHSSRWDHDVDLRGQAGRGDRHRRERDAVRARDRARGRARSRSSSGRGTGSRPTPNYHRAGHRRGEVAVPARAALPVGWYRFLQFWNSADRMYPAFRVDPDWPDQDVSISRPERQAAPRDDRARRARAGRASPSWSTRCCPTTRRSASACCRTTAGSAPCCATTSTGERAGRRGSSRTRSSPTSGRSYDADVSCSAPGSTPTSTCGRCEITGRGSRCSHDVWGDDPRAYLGITVPGFPNLFCLYGPNTNPVVGSVIFVLECQVNYIVKAIGAMLEHGYTTMECRRDVHDAYNERVDAEHEQLVWRHPRVHSYYNNDAGRVTTNMPWKLVDYWRMTHEPALDDFVVEPSAGRAWGLTWADSTARSRSSPERHRASAAPPRCASPRRVRRSSSSTSTSRAARAWSTRCAPRGSDGASCVGDVSTLDVAQRGGGHRGRRVRPPRRAREQRRHRPGRRPRHLGHDRGDVGPACSR